MRMLRRDRGGYRGAGTPVEKLVVANEKNAYGILFSDKKNPASRKNLHDTTITGSPNIAPERREYSRTGVPYDSYAISKLRNMDGSWSSEGRAGAMGYVVSRVDDNVDGWKNFLPTWGTALESARRIVATRPAEKGTGMDAVMGFVFSMVVDVGLTTSMAHKDLGSVLGPLCTESFTASMQTFTDDDDIAASFAIVEPEDDGSNMVNGLLWGSGHVAQTHLRTNPMAVSPSGNYSSDGAGTGTMGFYNSPLSEKQVVSDLCMAIDVMGNLLAGNGVLDGQDVVRLHVSSNMERVIGDAWSATPMGSGSPVPRIDAYRTAANLSDSVSSIALGDTTTVAGGMIPASVFEEVCMDFIEKRGYTVRSNHPDEIAAAFADADVVDTDSDDDYLDDAYYDDDDNYLDDAYYDD